MAKTSDSVVDQRISIEGDNQSSRPKIQRVPAFLRQNPDFARYCTPMMISFGPIHHRNKDLRLGQQLKNQWKDLYIQEYSIRTNKTATEAAEFLHKTVEDEIEELKNLFAEDVIEGYHDKELAEMLFLDGCSLLYFMEHNDYQRPEALNLKPDIFLYIHTEIKWMLENQLPLRLLEQLSKEQGADLDYLLCNFHMRGKLKRGEALSIKIRGPKPTHILEYCLSRFFAEEIRDDNNTYYLCVGDDTRRASFSGERDIWPTYKNIRDLKKAGIRVMKNESPREEWKWYKISFTSGWFSGKLRLPVFIYHIVARYLLVNSIAYESCPDNYRSNFECSMYFSFISSLIDDAEDVKELISAGVIINGFGSDEELVKFFSEICRDLPAFNYEGTEAVACCKRYIELKRQMEKHYSNKWKTWLAEARTTYFNTPWSLIALLAAMLGLGLTFLQTWYSAHPN